MTLPVDPPDEDSDQLQVEQRERMVQRVQDMLRSVGLTLHRVSLESRSKFKGASPYVIPHHLYTDLRRGETPHLRQVAALSHFTGICMTKWLATLGCDPNALANVSATLNRDRTMILPRLSANCTQEVRWWAALDPDVSLDRTDSLDHIIHRATMRTAGQIAAPHDRRYIYARVGTQDNIMHPVLESGSIVRVQPRAQPGSHKSRAIYLVQHSGGLTCGYVELLNGGVALVLPATDPQPVARGLLGRDILVIGVVDAEIRPLAALTREPLQLGRSRRVATQPTPHDAVRHVGELTRLHRERLGLDFRRAHLLAERVATRMGDRRYAISLGALSDYETMTSPPRRVEKLFTLCAIYGIDLGEYLKLSGVLVDSDTSYAATYCTECQAALPNQQVSTSGTSALVVDDYTQAIDRAWLDLLGEYPLHLISACEEMLDHREIVLDDIFVWGHQDVPLHPVLRRAWLLIVNRQHAGLRTANHDSKGRTSLHVVRTPTGRYLCGHCLVEGDGLTVLAHPAVPAPSLRFNRSEVTIVGSVDAVVRQIG